MDADTLKEGNDNALSKLENVLVRIANNPDIDERVKEMTIKSITNSLISQEYFFSGPVPPPEMLAQYEKILQGSADRIFTMTEKRINHSIEMEKGVFMLEKENVPKQIQQGARGQIFSFILCAGLIVLAAFCVYKGENWVAGTIVAFTIASVAALFITGKQSMKKK